MKARFLAAVAATFMLMSSVVTPVLAVEAVPQPEDRPVSLTVSFVDSDTEKGTSTAISGATFEITKVADLNWHGGSPEYILSDAFVSTEVDFNGMTASESEEAAKKFSAMNVKALKAGITDSSGSAMFDNLDQGIYLVKEIAKKGVAAGYSTVEPYLVLAPGYLEGEWTYDVTSFPKTTPVKTTIPTPDVPTPDEPAPEPATPVKTGDMYGIYLYMGLAVCAASGLMILMTVRKKHRKESKTDG